MHILVSTSPNRTAWLQDCLTSLGDLPVTVRSDHAFELGKIRWAYEHTTWDRFWLLQDSVVIKDPQFLAEAWALNSSVALTDDPAPFGMYLGIYTRATLDKLQIPWALSKADAIHYEIAFHRDYLEIEPSPVLFPGFNDASSNRTEDRHGRLNKVLENQHLIKYKGNWGQS